MGTSFPYLSNLLIRLDPSTKLDPESKNNTNNRYGVKGFVNKITIVKSRTAPAGVEFEVVYDQTDGFLNSLTDFQNLVDAGIITGRGTYTIPGLDEKVKIRDVKSEYINNEKFRNRLNELAIEYYKTLVPRSSNISYEKSMPEIKELENGLTLVLVEDDEDGGIWKELDVEDGKYYDVEGTQIEVEFE